ncbi:Mu transposase C-terminal domain-containing protein [Thermomonas fusca]|uniref:Transposase n=1 Tax=Thermomonas fusca TaxID=215690 RepID=A0A5R9PGZ5_9GAMM|nr:Mu transposase C-terminal domain-containing protein [Thermomonas fusca]TLX22486.1 transposase [Thermomonas fusca]
MHDAVVDNPIAVGAELTVEGVAYTIIRYIDLYSALAINVSTGERVRLSVAAMLEALNQPEAPPAIQESSQFETLSATEWELAQTRMSLLAPLLGDTVATRTEASRVAEQLGVHVATVYRWIRRLKSTGRISDLVPRKPSGGRGKARIDPMADAIINAAINDKYLQTQRPSISRLMRDILVQCRRAEITAPHPNTVRRRVRQLSERLLMERRLGRKAADDKFAARPGSFPGADYPGAVWQIDHTPLDLVVVDDVHRRHIGRPWLTVAIDVYSRCIAGFYLSLDPPSEVSVGMCLVHAMLPKEGWLAALGVRAQWPVYGRPNTVHADNGKEFRGSMISRAAEQHRFRMEWRKVKTPNWGGHIERLVGTFNQEVHALPGTTFSNIAERGQYAPHLEATLTFAEVEVYLTDYICGVYHQSVHGGIGRPPIRRYEAGLLGDGTLPGRGLPPPPADPKRLRLDFMPLLERSIQQYGIRIDGLTYYDPVLDPWIRATDPSTRRPRRFIVRRDPRDISVVYFLDPDTRQYYPIPFRNLERPSLTLWELREVRKQLKKEGKSEVDEDLVFETYERLNRLVEQAQGHKVTARKSAQKKRMRSKVRAVEKAQEGSVEHMPPASSDLIGGAGWESEDVAPFTVIKVR